MNTMNYSEDDSKSKFPADTPLAMMYVPWQQFNETYTENTALEKGTVFPELYYPFLGREVDSNDRK